MVKKNYEISGVLLDARTQENVGNLKVEVWDKDAKDQRLLDKTAVNAQGQFYLCFDESYFKEEAPDVFFRVLLGKKELLNTSAEPIMNIKPGAVDDIVLRVELPTIRTDRSDFLSKDKTVEYIDFFGKSDFNGTLAQLSEQIKLPTTMVRDVLGNTIRDLNLQPLKAQRFAGKKVVDEETKAVVANLEAQNVETQVLTYDPKLNRETLRSIKLLPPRIRPGQQVNLYEKDGRVAYYTITNKKPLVKETAAKDEAVVNTALLAERNKEIISLKKEIAELKASQATMNRFLQSEKVKAFLQESEPKPKPKQTRTRKTTSTRSKKKEE